MSTELMPVKNNTELVDRTPIRKHYDSTRPVSFLTEGEVNALVDHVKTERDKLIVLVTFQLALRISETLSITPQSRLRTDDGRCRLAILGKGNKPRIVAVPELLGYRLGDYIGVINVCDNARIFPISRQRAWKIIKAAAVAAGIDRRVYCHLLRHGGAVARLKRTGNPKSLQLHLGHSDFKMTMRYLATLQVMDSLDIEDKVKF